MNRILSIIIFAMLVPLALSGCSPSGSTSSTTGTDDVTGSASLISSSVLGQNQTGQVQALGLNYYIALQGVAPAANGSQTSNGDPYIGQIMLFAGDFAPAGWQRCDGTLLNISTNAVLYALIGTTYGGDGVTTFAVPDLRGSLAMGAGGLSGTFDSGVETTNVPLISSLAWGATAQGQVTGVGINYFVATSGIYPAANGSTNTSEPFVGQIMMFAGTVAPGGWQLCDGSLIDISSNGALYALLGTAFGGDGTTTFGVPNLQASAPIGVGQLANPIAVNFPVGAPQMILISDLNWGGTAQGQIVTQGINFDIATSGVFPSANGNGESQFYLGQILMFAGNFVPGGYHAADGSSLTISSSAALFNLLSNTFGGDGTTDFDIPDLRGRVAIGVK